MPRHADIGVSIQKGDFRADNIFDGTAHSAAQMAADGLQGYQVNPGSPWFKLSFEIQRGRKIDDTGKEWLEEAEDVMKDLFAHSNYYDVLGEVIMDTVTIGTGCMYIEENRKKGGVRFRSMSPAEMYYAENADGEIDTVARLFKMQHREIVKRYGETLDKEQKKIMQDTPFEEEEILHIVFPREDRDLYKIDNLNMEYGSLHILVSSDKLLRESGYKNMPYIVWRYRKVSGEVYGRSPAWDAIGDIRASQQIMRTLLRKANLSAAPPWNAPHEMKEEGVEITPDGMNWYVDPSRVAVPIDVGSNYPIGKDMQEVVQTAIRAAYRVDMFVLMSQMAGQKMTATQIIEMRGEKAAILGTLVSRMSSELFNPTFDRVFAIAQDSGWLPEIPGSLMEILGASIKVDYISPLSQAMKQHFNASAATQSLMQTISLFEVFPNLRHLIDEEELGRFLLGQGGVPEKVIKDGPEYQTAIEQAAQEIIEQVNSQKAQQQADAYQKMTRAPEEGSAAEAMMGGGLGL